MKIIKTFILCLLLSISFQRTLRKSKKATKKKLDSEYFVWIDVGETSNWTEGYISPSKISDTNNDENKRGIIIRVTKINNELSSYIAQSGTNYILPYRKVSTTFSYEMPWTAYNFVQFYSNNKKIRFKTNAIDNDDGLSITALLNNARNSRRNWVSSRVATAQSYANQYSTKSSTLTAAKGGKTSVENQITKQNSDITVASKNLETSKSNLANAIKLREDKEKQINSIKQQLAELTTKINQNDDASADFEKKVKELQTQVSQGKLDAKGFKDKTADSKLDFEENMTQIDKQLALQTRYLEATAAAKQAILGDKPNLALFKEKMDSIVS